LSAIERMPASDYEPKAGLSFVDVYQLHSLYADMAFYADLLIQGPKGCGKTLSVQAYAAQIKCPIVTFDCSEDVRRSHLLGQFVLRGAYTPFVLGPLTTAFEIANETGQCILVLEELNGLSSVIQKVLNGATDFRRRIEVPECQKVFQLRGDSKLWVVGTLNSSTYGGVFAINEDLKSRFRVLALDYPTAAQEKQILEETLPTELMTQLGTDEVTRIHRLAQETRQKAFEYALSPRDVRQLAEDMVRLGKTRALRLMLGKFEDNDRNTIRARIKSIFNVTIEDGAVA
jgi:MoxR-like ATPase